MIAGDFNDISEEGSHEFANMKATNEGETGCTMGREPTEMSRPATTTRAGFMDSQGTGVHVPVSVRTALELGVPISGIVAFTSISTYDPSLICPFFVLIVLQRQSWAHSPFLLLEWGHSLGTRYRSWISTADLANPLSVASRLRNG